MEDSFPSSPNSVTKTRFRNKILRTLFPFPPYLPTSGGNIPSPRHLVPTMLLRAVWGGDVSRARGGGGEEECDRATGHNRVANPHHVATSPQVQDPDLTPASLPRPREKLWLQLSNFPSPDIYSRLAYRTSTRHTV